MMMEKVTMLTYDVETHEDNDSTMAMYENKDITIYDNGRSNNINLRMDAT